MKFLDKNGDEIYVGASVDVPDPKEDGQWIFCFTGIVIEFNKDEGYCIVEDGDGDCWCVEPERLELE